VNDYVIKLDGTFFNAYLNGAKRSFLSPDGDPVVIPSPIDVRLAQVFPLAVLGKRNRSPSEENEHGNCASDLIDQKFSLQGPPF